MLFKKNLLKLENVNGYHDMGRQIDVFVEEKVAERHLQERDIIPKNVGIVLINRKKTNVVEIGEVKAQNLIKKPNKQRYRPVICGCQISPLGSDFVGTLGGIFKRQKLKNTSLQARIFSKLFKKKMLGDGFEFEDELVGLTNAHVGILDCRLPIRKYRDYYDGLIVQPSGVTDECIIGKVIEYPQIKEKGINEIDACVFLLDYGIRTDPEDFGTERVNIKGFRQAQVGSEVKKYGRTTQYTTGRVLRRGVVLNINFGRFSAIFKDLIMFSKMTLAGDSGSIVFDKEGYAVALLNSGSDSYSFGIPMPTITKKLGLEVIKNE